jgi:hypothetical protein
MNKKQANTTKIIFAVVLVTVQLFIVQASHAQNQTRGLLRDLKQEVVQEKKEIVKEKTQNILEQVKNVIKEKIKKHIKGTLTAMTGNVLTVRQGQTNLTIRTTDKTEFKRKFGGISSLGEFSINDQLIIIGNRNADSTEIEASYIRNMSIQRRFAVFVGEVTAKSSSVLTLKTESRGAQTAIISSNTTYKEKNKTITFADIQIGDKILVKGELWDRASDKIDAKAVLRLNTRKPATVTQAPEGL